MIRALRRRASDERSDAGLSLVELLVASFISMLMLALISTMFIQITRLTGSAQSTKDATGVAWTVTNEISAVVRQGTQVDTSATVTEGAVVAGSTSSSLVIDAFVDAAVAGGQPTIAPTQVTFRVSGGYLTEQRVVGVLTNGYYTFTGAGTTRTVAGPNLTTGTAAYPLFVYKAGTTPIVPGATGLSASDAAQVTAVGINVIVTKSVAGGSDTVRLVNLITMPNLAIVNGGS